MPRKAIPKPNLRPNEVWECTVYICPSCAHATHFAFVDVVNGWWWCKYCYAKQRGGRKDPTLAELRRLSDALCWTLVEHTKAGVTYSPTRRERQTDAWLRHG